MARRACSASRTPLSLSAGVAVAALGSVGMQRLARAPQRPVHPAVVQRRAQRVHRQRHRHGLDLELVAHVQRVALVKPHRLGRTITHFGDPVPQEAMARLTKGTSCRKQCRCKLLYTRC